MSHAVEKPPPDNGNAAASAEGDGAQFQVSGERDTSDFEIANQAGESAGEMDDDISDELLNDIFRRPKASPAAHLNGTREPSVLRTRRERLTPVHWADGDGLADHPPLIKGVIDRGTFSMWFGPFSVLK